MTVIIHKIKRNELTCKKSSYIISSVEFSVKPDMNTVLKSSLSITEALEYNQILNITCKIE